MCVQAAHARITQRQGRGGRAALIALATAGIVFGGGAALPATTVTPATVIAAPTPNPENSAPLRLPSEPATSTPVRLLPAPAPALVNSDAFEALSELNQKHPARLAFTAGERAAAEFIAAELTAIGFGPDAISVQNFGRSTLTGPQLGALERLGWSASGIGAAAPLDYSQNVIVQIPGSGSGVVIIGAHYDTFMSGEFSTEFAIGTNVALLLDTARVLHNTATELEQTVYLVFFGAESVALSGSRNFFENLPETSLDIRLLVNVDSIGAAPDLFFSAAICDGGERCEELSDPFASVVSQVAAGVSSELALFKDEEFGFGSEIPTCACCLIATPAAPLGVPVVNLFAFDASEADAIGQLTEFERQVQTERALTSYQDFIHALLQADLSVTP